MKRIRSGMKTDTDGVLLTIEEYQNYKKLTETIHNLIRETKHRPLRKTV